MAATAEKDNVTEPEKMYNSVTSAKRSLGLEQRLEQAASYSGPSEQPWKLVTTK